MKKVIHSKMAATTFADFDHFSIVTHSWQKRCHGNILGYCTLKTVSKYALYNYNKSQKVPSAYCKLFQHSKEKTFRGHKLE